jgi:hypothetical protein
MQDQTDRFPDTLMVAPFYDDVKRTPARRTHMTTIWGPGPTEYRFFWSTEIARFDSEEEAKLFVQRLKDDPAVMTAFRRLLDPLGDMSLGNGDGDDDDKDDALIEATASLLAGGDLIADLTTTTSFEPMWRYHGLFRDRHIALNFLSRFRRDPIAVARLRNMLHQRSPGANLLMPTLSVSSMDQMFATLANLLATRALIPSYRLHATAGTVSDDEKLAPVRSSSPTAAAPLPSSKQKEEEAEEPTFPDNDGAAQAAALRAAAVTGVPFCEECAKAAAAQAAQKV